MFSIVLFRMTALLYSTSKQEKQERVHPCVFSVWHWRLHLFVNFFSSIFFIYSICFSWKILIGRMFHLFQNLWGVSSQCNYYRHQIFIYHHIILKILKIWSIPSSYLWQQSLCTTEKNSTTRQSTGTKQTDAMDARSCMCGHNIDMPWNDTNIIVPWQLFIICANLHNRNQRSEEK